MDPLAFHREALGVAQRIVDDIDRSHFELPTPATSGTFVRCSSTSSVATAASPATLPAEGEDVIGDDLSAAYAACGHRRCRGVRGATAASTARTRCRSASSPATSPCGRGPTDQLAHAWDLAKATGMSTDLSPEMYAIGSGAAAATGSRRAAATRASFADEKPAARRCLRRGSIRRLRRSAAMSARVALVTGAGSGIGRAVSIGLAADGFVVVLAGRRHEALDETAAWSQRLRSRSRWSTPWCSRPMSPMWPKSTPCSRPSSGGSAVSICCSTTPASARRRFRWTNCRSTTGRRVVDTNLTGSFLCAQRAMAMMKRQQPGGGRIINNGSISAHTPRPNSAPYTATKHAITGLTKSIALDGRPYGITCGQIDIGNAETPMTARMADGVLQPDGSRRPEPRMDVDDAARAVRYMASLPPDSNVLFLTVMAAGMPFVGRG